MTQGSLLNSTEVRTRIEKYVTLIFQQMICKTLAEKKLGCWIESVRRKFLAVCVELTELSMF